MMSDLETVSLHRLSELPFAADEKIFREYPGFKLGVTRCVRYFAQLLLPFVKEVIADEKGRNDWILTAPPITAQTPAAANLLCWELFALCVHDQGLSSLSLIDMHHESDTTWVDWKDPNKSQDYARLEFTDRVTEHKRISQRLAPNDNFRDRPVLFVNDICVTGAQQHAMRQYFHDVKVAGVKWLYIIVADPEIGRTDPALEWRINFAPFDDLLRMVSQEQIQFTGKCVQRLMSLSLAELEQVLSALDQERRTRILEIATRNGFENMDGFREQLKLVKSYNPETTVDFSLLQDQFSTP
jgi:hypothetical protein